MSPGHPPPAALLKWAQAGPGGIGAGVAESDLGTAPAVEAALADAVARHQLGYTPPALVERVAGACASWLADELGWEVPPAHVRAAPDVLTAMRLCITQLTPPGSAVIVPTPAYPPFLEVPGLLGRAVVELALDPAPAAPPFDVAALEDAFDRGGHLLVLCHPHNPLGRVLTRPDLEAIATVVARRGGRVFADEVHAPLVYAPHRHIPYASVGDEAAAHTITATSASKAWNVAGLRCAEVVLTSAADRARWDGLGRLVAERPSMLGAVAAIAAFDDGRAWLAGLLAQLDTNRRLLGEELRRRLPGVRYEPPAATFLAWLDAAAVVEPGTDVAGRLRTGGVSVVGGAEFGVAPTYLRVNFATSPSVLRALVARASGLLTARAD